MTSTTDSRPKRRVFVVENHLFFRENLVNWIRQQDELECCGEAGSVPDARRAVETLRPDLLLLDISLDEGHGFELLHWLEGREPRLPVIVLSQHEEGRYAEPAMEAGARGYVSKAAATEELYPAIEAVLDGQCYVSGRGAFRAPLGLNGA